MDSKDEKRPFPESDLTESAPKKDLINPSLNYLKADNKKQYTLSDEFVYRLESETPPDHFFYVTTAGISNPDPKYRVNRESADQGTPARAVIEYVISGEGYIVYEGIRKKVHAGDLYILTPGFTGSYFSYPENPFLKKWINLRGTITKHLLKAYEISGPCFIVHVDAESFFDRMFSILSDYDESDPDDDNLKLIHILIDLLDIVKRNLSAKSLPFLSIDDLTKYIDDNITSRKLSVSLLADRFYLSERTIHRMFLKELSMTPNDYITRIKIDHAKKMLLEKSVEQVANELKFSDPDYFRRVFIKICGISPQKYKTQVLTFIRGVQ